MKLLAYKIVGIAIAIAPLSYAYAAMPPLAITNNVTGITQTSATLWGVVDANGAAAIFWFEYGTSYSFGSRVATQFPPNSGRMNVSADLSGLEPYTTYYYRVVAQNALGTSYGDVEQFKSGWRYVSSQSISGTAKSGGQTAGATSTPVAAKKTVKTEVVREATSTTVAAVGTAAGTSTVTSTEANAPQAQAKRGSFLANMWATVSNISGYVWFFTFLLIAIVVVTYGFFRMLRKHTGHGGHDEEEMMGHNGS